MPCWFAWRRRALIGAMILGMVGAAQVVRSGEPTRAVLQSLDPRVLEQTDTAAREVVRREVRARIQLANQRETEQWHQLHSRADWQRYCDQRLAALRRSLGTLPQAGAPLNVRVTGHIATDGVIVENLLFESRPGLTVTANLYRPDSTAASLPGIVICHSHHAPKTQSELQTMGLTWARHDALVLVMDQVGHGERRTHRFASADSYSREFRPGRQDYYFRYNTGIQLQLLGESLMGWMVGDLMRGIDLLLAQPQIDAQRIVLLGAVAGGGDPVGVTATLDARVAVAAPFNFGGYEPEEVYPLPDDAETTFNYAGNGSWESTRNLRLSARDGFMPWVIVGSIAPRRLVYAHEFRWDQERDPVWKRLQQVFEWYEVPERLAFVVGRGSVKGRPPEASHCTNIGAVHRAQLYPILQRWAEMAPPREIDTTLDASQLACLPADGSLSILPLHQVLSAEVRRLAQARSGPLDMKRLTWLLGDCDPESAIAVRSDTTETHGSLQVERICLERRSDDAALPLPLLLLRSQDVEPQSPPRLVIGVTQQGKADLLRQRTVEIDSLLERGAWLALVDLRGIGETQPAGEGRGRMSGATSRSATQWMLGETVLGQRLSDLRTIITFLRKRLPDSRVALWGEGLVESNSETRDLAAPLDADDLPSGCEPLGALVCLLAALFEPSIDTLYAAGGLGSFDSLLSEPYFYVPHDAIVPGILQVGDIVDWVVALQPRRVWLADVRDHQNRRLAVDRLLATYAPAIVAASQRGQAERLKLTALLAGPDELASWLTNVKPAHP